MKSGVIIGVTANACEFYFIMSTNAEVIFEALLSQFG